MYISPIFESHDYPNKSPNPPLAGLGLVLFFCYHFLVFIFSLLFLQQAQDGPSSPAAKRPKKNN